MLSCFTSINSYFDQENEISIFLCTVKVPKNDLSLHCRRKTKELSKKELSNVTPALMHMRYYTRMAAHCTYSYALESEMFTTEIDSGPRTNIFHMNTTIIIWGQKDERCSFSIKIRITIHSVEFITVLHYSGSV
jgi:hypothetical protein